MDHNVVQFIGASCGQHGPYTFYKAFKYKKNSVDRIVKLGEFFFVKLWIDSDLLCIGELQLLWIDKNSEQVLASLRLYFLPENTPEGRMDHGEDEVLAIAEKVVLRVEDLVTWITLDADWNWGRLGKCCKQVKEPPDGNKIDVGPVSLSDSSLDFADVEKEKQVLENEEHSLGPSVVILSYPKYCRYRSMMRRLEGVEDEYLKYNVVKALGGFSFCDKNTRVMFCRDTFDYPDLEGHEMLCNHLAPKLKGRPRGKRKKRSVSPGSESNESECSVMTTFTPKSARISSEPVNNKNGYCLDGTTPRRSTRSSDNSDTKEFLKKLTSFMKMKRTPLGRTPCLGSKEIDLHDFYTRVQKMGGYDAVISNRLWKSISNDMSGQQISGAATVIKRHYERFLLPYERHIRGEEYKPLPVSERRRLKSKSANNSTGSEINSGVDRNVPLCSTSIEKTPSPKSADTQNFKETIGNIKQEPKISSLRSVRVKPERQKDKFAKVVKMEEISSDKDGLEIIKVEKTEIPKEEDNLDQKPSVTLENTSSEENSPTTESDKSEELNSPPAECKETDLCETKDEMGENQELQIVNVPSNPTSSDENDQKVPSLESIKLEKSSLNAPFIDELRKEKLDILKEGGLEVTPVRNVPPSNDAKDIFIPTAHLAPKPSRNEVQQVSTSLQGVPVDHLPLNIPQSLNISKVTVPVPAKSGKVFSFPEKADSTTPPKVVQSRSIYSYSEKTVYGNPKDYLVNSYSVHTPKAPVNLMKPTGGDLLDLTVASPQKPIFETRVPSIPTSFFNTQKNVVKAANLPIFEGRKLGSNLEITLVDSKDKMSSPYVTDRLKNAEHTASRTPSKRTSTDSFNRRRTEENGEYIKPSTSGNNRSKKYREEIQANHTSVVNKRPSSKTENTVAEGASSAKYFPQGVQYPPYISQFYEGNKGVNPYFPMIDPLLYSAALHSLYPQASAPLLQFTSQEQLKLYSELMAQQSRVPYPFRMPNDEEFSNNTKK